MMPAEFKRLFAAAIASTVLLSIAAFCQTRMSAVPEGSVLRGRVLYRVTDAQTGASEQDWLGDAHIFVLSTDEKRILGYSRGLAGPFEVKGAWEISGLPESGEVIVVAFSDSVHRMQAIRRISLTGSKHQDIGRIEVSLSTPSLPSAAIGANPVWAVLDLLGWVSLEVARNRAEVRADQLSQQLLNEIGASGPRLSSPTRTSPPVDLDQTKRPDSLSSLWIVEGKVAGQTITANSPIIRVAPGTRITGELALKIYSEFASNAVMTLGATPTWGAHSDSVIDFGHFSTPIVGQLKIVGLNLTAPQQVGTYHIIFAFQGEFNAANLLSCTNWSDGTPIWGDGDDVADLTGPDLESASTTGRIHQICNTSDGKTRARFLPAASLHVEVR